MDLQDAEELGKQALFWASTPAGCGAPSPPSYGEQRLAPSSHHEQHRPPADIDTSIALQLSVPPTDRPPDPEDAMQNRPSIQLLPPALDVVTFRNCLSGINRDPQLLRQLPSCAGQPGPGLHVLPEPACTTTPLSSNALPYTPPGNIQQLCPPAEYSALEAHQPPVHPTDHPPDPMGATRPPRLLGAQDFTRLRLRCSSALDREGQLAKSLPSTAGHSGSVLPARAESGDTFSSSSRRLNQGRLVLSLGKCDICAAHCRSSLGLCKDCLKKTFPREPD